jgi:hypothetical protein
VIIPTISQTMDQPGIAVETKDDGRVLGEQDIEVSVGQSVGMLTLRLQRHQVSRLMTRILSSGKCWRGIPTAAGVSNVGTSPGSIPASLFSPALPSSSEPWSHWSRRPEDPRIDRGRSTAYAISYAKEK